MRFQTRGLGGFGGGGRFGSALTPVVKRLLIANIVVFLFAFAMPRGLAVDLFAFDPDRLLTRPWGLFTYMFVHADFMHIFVNMLVLFFFGPSLESKWGSREFTKFYLIAGLGAIAFSFLFQSVAVIGASGAVYGVMLAFAMNWPRAPIYIWGIFPVQAWLLIGFFFLMSLFSAFGGAGGGVAHFAHLGGIVTAFLYLKMDWRLPSAANSAKKTARRVRRLAIVPRDEDEDRQMAEVAQGQRKQEEERQILDAVDQVLDKISQHGMGSLTSAERKLLDEVSRRHRMN